MADMVRRIQSTQNMNDYTRLKINKM